ncbi:MAG: hypothetical protein PF517_08765 [Salinivirgaceae bacterium]|jgi:hypothetical protein|nr:hypothetical protein [Salinivirgaceae bacterium]
MVLETFGSIIKEEQVKTVERGILPGTFVLENMGMFPGYYGSNMPHTSAPDSIFLVMTQKESTEKILRLTHNIKKFSELEFEGAIATLYVHNNDYHAIRLRKLKGFDHIAEIQEHYRDGGITFAKVKQLDENAVIQIKKVFKLTSVAENIFINVAKDMYYLKIDEQLTWSQFRKIVMQVRNNISLSAFDVALGVIYGKQVLDVVRVYTTSLTVEELTKLHDKFEEIIAKSLK